MKELEPGHPGSSVFVFFFVFLFVFVSFSSSLPFGCPVKKIKKRDVKELEPGHPGSEAIHHPVGGDLLLHSDCTATIYTYIYIYTHTYVHI